MYSRVLSASHTLACVARRSSAAHAAVRALSASTCVRAVDRRGEGTRTAGQATAGFIMNALKRYNATPYRQRKNAELQTIVREFYRRTLDFREVNRDWGLKPFLGLPRLLDAETAAPFPEVKGTSVTGKPLSVPGSYRGHVTLVLISFNQFGRLQLEDYYKSFAAHFKDNPNVRIVEISVVERWVLKAFNFLLAASLRNSVPAERGNNIISYATHTKALWRALELPNRFLGHAYLLDAEGRIRYRLMGSPVEWESQVLVDAAGSLLEGRDAFRRVSQSFDSADGTRFSLMGFQQAQDAMYMGKHKR